MSDCLFCKIIEGEVPCRKVYEDYFVMAFFTIEPVAPGHTLVVPKRHYANYEEIDDATLAEVYSKVKLIGSKIKSALNVPAYNTLVNNGPVAGQIIPHLHVHIIPRNEGDGLIHWPGHPYEEGEADAILAKIINKF